MTGFRRVLFRSQVTYGSSETSGIAMGDVSSTDFEPGYVGTIRKGIRLVQQAGSENEPGDLVFILLIGHGSFDGRQAAFNLPGPDLTADDAAGLLKKLTAQRVVFINTASASGAFVDVLKGQGRLIITATRTGGERNETRLAPFLVEALESEDRKSTRLNSSHT